MQSLVIPKEASFKQLTGKVQLCRQVGDHIGSFSPCCSCPADFDKFAAKVTEFYKSVK